METISTSRVTIFKGVIHATWHDWSGKDGGKHGAAAPQRRAPVRSLRHVAESSERVSPGESVGKLLTAGSRDEAREAPGGMVNGPGGCRGPGDWPTPAPSL